MSITINAEQKLFVIPSSEGGYSCLGFDVLEKRAVALCRWLASVNKSFNAPQPEAYATLARYTQYETFLLLASNYCAKHKVKCPCELTPQLVGLEGKRVEVTGPNDYKARFTVRRSSGWMPCHLEIKTRRSMGGCAAYIPEGATIRVVD